MAKRQALLLLLFVCEIVSHAVGNQSTIISTEKPIRPDLFYMRNFDTSKAIDQILSQKWIENHECLSELNAIRNGIENHDEWAIRVVDSWGNFPAGTRNENVNDPGSFFGCFHIQRNGTPYNTQHCIGKLFAKMETRISLGICLPANCNVRHLETIVNDVMHANNVTVRIPEYTCQSKERPMNLKPMDFVAIGLFAIVFLAMIASTCYDIVCTANNHTKYQPCIVFSIYTNGKKLFTCENPEPSSTTIQCLDGIRVLSTMWIVLVHVIIPGYTTSALHERTPLYEFITSYAGIVPCTPIAVDTFFAISGMLVSYKMFRLIKKNRRLNFLSLYWHRYLRLTPLLSICILVMATIYRFFGSGPFWPGTASRKAIACKHYWWSSLLYTQNYVNRLEMCIPSTWYLSVDMQLFIIAPVLVYFVHRFKKPALFALVASILCCIGYTLTAYVKNNVSLFMRGGYYEVYYATHIRFPSWLIGFICGYLLFEFPKASIRIPKKLNLSLLTLSLIAMPAVLIGNHPYLQITPTLSPLVYGLYDTVSRSVWVTAICYIVFACAHGSGGPINNFLSLSAWQPLSRLSYCIYLVHYDLIGLIMGSVKTPPYFSEISAIQNFISIFVLAAFIAIPLVLAFELPIDSIVKLTTGSDKPRIHATSTPDSLKNIGTYSEQ